jgi:hypothetical protein
VLQNAEVVDIVTYAGAPSLKLYALHASWVAQVATRSTRHKLLKFLRDNEQLREAAAEGAAQGAPAEAAPAPLTAPGGGGGWSALDPALRLEWAEEAPLGSQPPKPALADGGQEALAGAIAGAEGGAGAPPTALYSMLNSLLMLRVECGDRTGLLADVSGLITRHGLFIRAYSGKPLDEGRGTCSMGFELGGDSRRVEQLCSELDAVRGVLRWQAYCTLPCAPP